eukprot:COSAG04_NODE_9664_length_842_cov_1.056528_2_plen_84_part_01
MAWWGFNSALIIHIAKVLRRGGLCGQVPKLAALAAGLELTAQQLAYCQHNTSATNCSRLPPLLPVSSSVYMCICCRLGKPLGSG